MLEPNGISAALADRRARIADSTESADMATIRDAVGRVLTVCLGPEGLRQAFGHAPGVIGAAPPFGLALWIDGLTKTGAYTASAAGTDYTGYGGGDMDEQGNLDLIVAVAPNAPDLPRLQAAAEAWQDPLKFAVTANPTCCGTVEAWEWRGFTMEVWPWGPTDWYVAVGHTHVQTLTTAPVPL